MPARRISVVVFVAVFLAIQLVLPVWLMAVRPEGGSSRFGWQMFSEVPRLPELAFEMAGGAVEPITIADHTQAVRADVNYLSAIPEFCRLIPDAVAIVAEGRERTPCAR